MIFDAAVSRNRSDGAPPIATGHVMHFASWLIKPLIFVNDRAAALGSH